MYTMQYIWWCGIICIHVVGLVAHMHWVMCGRVGLYWMTVFTSVNFWGKELASNNVDTKPLTRHSHNFWPLISHKNGNSNKFSIVINAKARHLPTRKGKDLWEWISISKHKLGWSLFMCCTNYSLDLVNFHSWAMRCADLVTNIWSDEFNSLSWIVEGFMWENLVKETKPF